MSGQLRFGPGRTAALPTSCIFRSHAPLLPRCHTSRFLQLSVFRKLVHRKSVRSSSASHLQQDQQLESSLPQHGSETQQHAASHVHAVSEHQEHAANGVINGATVIANGAHADAAPHVQQPDAAAEASAEAPAEAPKASGPQQAAKFANRVFFGVVLGVVGGLIIMKGSYLFLTFMAFVTYQATQEYYGFMTSIGMAKGQQPPPPLVSSLTTLLCVSMPLFSFFFKGNSGTILAVASFFLLVLEVVAIRKPKFSQLASSLFGLFYCGWLPAFWVKLRMRAHLAPESSLASVAGMFTTWTIGLLATLTSVLCVIAADTGAYFVGKSLGRTKLTDISPKKTVEGALGGLASSMVVAMAMQKLTSWPATPLAAAGLGVLVFFSSLFGDLIESIMKRDAGMKDSGDLIPGHGGLLDRFDSYMFTGSTTYFYVVFVLPNLG